MALALYAYDTEGCDSPENTYLAPIDTTPQGGTHSCQGAASYCIWDGAGLSLLGAQSATQVQQLAAAAES